MDPVPAQGKVPGHLAESAGCCQRPPLSPSHALAMEMLPSRAGEHGVGLVMGSSTWRCFTVTEHKTRLPCKDSPSPTTLRSCGE